MDGHRRIVYVCVKAIELDILLLVGLIIDDFSRSLVWVVGRQAKLAVADVLDGKLV